MKQAKNPLPDFFDDEDVSPLRTDNFSLKDASKFFNGRSPSKIRLDCAALGIDTSKPHYNEGSLTRKEVWVLYVYMFWRAVNKRCWRKTYWIDMTVNPESYDKCSAKTADQNLRLAIMKRAGGSRQHFDRRYNRILEEKRGRRVIEISAKRLSA